MAEQPPGPDRRAMVRNVALGLATVSVCGGIAGWIVGSLGTGGEGCGALDYPGRQAETDYCADSEGRVAMAGLEVTATPLRRVDGGNLCTAVAYANHTGRSVAIGPSDWHLRAPDGALLADVSGVGGGELDDGATRESTQCFPSTAASGQVVTLFEPTGIDGHRGVWLMTV